MTVLSISLAFPKHKWQVQISNIRDTPIAVPSPELEREELLNASTQYSRTLQNLCIRLGFSSISVSGSCDINSSEQYDKLSTQCAEVGMQLLS